jgi:hypothetical protein
MQAVGMWMILALAGTGGQTGSLKALLTPEQAEGLAMKLTERRPFLDSREAKSSQGRQTMGLFFGDDDYRILKGTPVFGYWDASTFKWSGGRIAWQGIASAGKTCKGISSKAWNLAFAYVAKKYGLVVDRAAPLRMRGACVWAVTEASPREPVRGVVMEMRLDSPTGAFRWRYSRGNPTIEGAVGAAVELPILLGKKLGQGGSPDDR